MRPPGVVLSTRVTPSGRTDKVVFPVFGPQDLWSRVQKRDDGCVTQWNPFLKRRGPESKG